MPKAPNKAPAPGTAEHQDFLNHPATTDHSSVFVVRLTKNGAVSSNREGIKPVATAQAPECISREEQTALVQALFGRPKDLAVVAVMLHTGLRVGVMCSLRRDLERTDGKAARE